MNISATFIGGVMFLSIIFIGFLSYYLGKRKTKTPKITALIGILLSFIPPLGLIYLAILVFKSDIHQNNTGKSVS